MNTTSFIDADLSETSARSSVQTGLGRTRPSKAVTCYLTIVIGVAGRKKKKNKQKRIFKPRTAGLK